LEWQVWAAVNDVGNFSRSIGFISHFQIRVHGIRLLKCII